MRELLKEDDMRYQYRLGRWHDKLHSYIGKKIQALALNDARDIVKLVILPLVEEFELPQKWWSWVNFYCPEIPKAEIEAIFHPLVIHEKKQEVVV